MKDDDFGHVEFVIQFMSKRESEILTYSSGERLKLTREIQDYLHKVSKLKSLKLES